jgi:hypothetical protein
MGRKSNTEWVWILKDADLCYSKAKIDIFIEMWNDGQSIKAIAERLSMQIYEVGLLVIHCELEGQITPRDGGLMGTKRHRWKVKV